jgi:hypothetical protein
LLVADIDFSGTEIAITDRYSNQATTIWPFALGIVELICDVTSCAVAREVFPPAIQRVLQYSSAVSGNSKIRIKDYFDRILSCPFTRIICTDDLLLPGPWRLVIEMRLQIAI